MRRNVVNLLSIVLIAIIVSTAVMTAFGIGAGVTQFKSGTASTGTLGVAFNLDVIHDDWIIVNVGASLTTTSVTGITDTAGTSYSLILRSHSQVNVEMWMGHYTAASALDTVTVALSGADIMKVTLVEVANLLSGTPVNTTSGSGTSTCATCTSAVAAITPLTNSFCESATEWGGTNAFTFSAYDDPFSPVVNAGGGTVNFLGVGARMSWSSGLGSTTAGLTVTHTSATAKYDSVMACWSGTGAELTSTTTTTEPTTTTTTTSTTATDTVTNTATTTTTTTNTTTTTRTNTETTTTTQFNGTQTITTTSTSTTTAIVVQNTTAQISLEAAAIGIILLLAIIVFTLWKKSGRYFGPIAGVFGGFAGIYLTLQIMQSQGQGGLIIGSGFDAVSKVFYNDVIDGTPFIYLSLFVTMICFLAAAYKAWTD